MLSQLFIVLVVNFIVTCKLTNAMISTNQKVVILGGGIHGTSIAYYLSSQYGIKSTVIEYKGIASAASGKSGGFLARDWGSSITQQLHKVSFKLHEELAKDLNIESYRRIPTLSVNGNRKGKVHASWLDRTASTSILGEGTAQVTPLELVNKFIEHSSCEIIIGKAQRLEIYENTVVGIHVEGHNEIIQCDKVVIAMGPWSGVFCEDNFNIAMPMEGIKSTSIIYQNVNEVKVEPYALFCDEDINNCHLELYPRSNGDLYVCGLGGSDYVSGDRLRQGGDCESSDIIQADQKRVTAAVNSIRTMSHIGDLDPTITQACMRPCPPDGYPIMGKIPDFENCYMSAGHNCWGILWAPASGKAMAELIAEGTSKTLDLSQFGPGRFQEKLSRRGKKVGGVQDIGEQW